MCLAQPPTPQSWPSCSCPSSMSFTRLIIIITHTTLIICHTINIYNISQDPLFYSSNDYLFVLAISQQNQICQLTIIYLMKIKASIPKKSASLLLLRPTPPSNISLFNYQILVLHRKEKLSFGSGLVFPGGKLEPIIDQKYRIKYQLKSDLYSAALRQCFEETGLYFFNKPLLESHLIDKLSKIRIEYIAGQFNQIKAAKAQAYEKISQLLTPSQNLTPFIRLITIPEIKQRYDTTFYVLPVQQYKYVNFMKYAQHQKYLHSLDKIIYCQSESQNFRWLSPAEIIDQHFKKKSLIHPPQFIMLNIMLNFYKHQQFIAYLKSFQPTAKNPQNNLRNLNLGPNIVSLIMNKQSMSTEYPYAATLLGDSQFPFDKIIANEEAQDLKTQMSEWKEWQGNNLIGCKNRFLFPEGKKFFEKEYQVQANAPSSAMKQMKPWTKVHQILKDSLIPSQ